MKYSILIMLFVVSLLWADDKSPFMPEKDELPKDSKYTKIPERERKHGAVSNPGYMAKIAIEQFNAKLNQTPGSITNIYLVNVNADSYGFFGYFVFSFKDEKALKEAMGVFNSLLIRGGILVYVGKTDIILFQSRKNFSELEKWGTRLQKRLKSKNKMTFKLHKHDKSIKLPTLVQPGQSGLYSIACKSNLKQIGVACVLYQQDYGRSVYFPDTLKTLYDKKILIEAKVYHCPAEKAHRHGKDLHINYAYLYGKNFLRIVRRSDHAKTILAYCLHHMGEVNVLFMDGHVDNIETKKFKMAYEKQAAMLKKSGYICDYKQGVVGEEKEKSK